MMEIRFSGIFYPPAAIKRSIQEYRNIADFACRRLGGDTLVAIKNIRSSELRPLFKEEFCNYVLSQVGLIK